MQFKFILRHFSCPFLFSSFFQKNDRLEFSHTLVEQVCSLVLLVFVVRCQTEIETFVARNNQNFCFRCVVSSNLIIILASKSTKIFLKGNFIWPSEKKKEITRCIPATEIINDDKCFLICRTDYLTKRAINHALK